MQDKWHALELSEIFLETKSAPSGLLSSDAKQRLKDFGRNVLPKEKPRSKIGLFLSQFNNPLTYILLAAVAVSFFLRHYSDTAFIIFVLLINIAVGFYQENKADESLSALKKIVRIRSKVLRDGNEKEIDSEELVVGDVVMLKSGDKVPADGRIIEAKGLKINESSLTGEWQAAEKNADDLLPEDTPVAERTNMVFMGTIVEEGRVTVVIVSVGAKTQIGKVVTLLKETKERKTPLQREILTLSKWLGVLIFSFIAIILIEGYLRGKEFEEVFLASLALAVSAIPEGLLPVITVILVLGMRFILKQKGLVRKLVAAETLGSVTVICTDKTGTLTEGKMQVSHILTGSRELLGDEMRELAKKGSPNGAESHISALKIAALANEGFVENPEAELQEWIVRGKPTEKALILAAMQSGLNKQELERQFPILDRISFESEHKFAATLHRKNEKQNMLYVIGAPEEIIARSVELDVDGKKEKLGTAKTLALMEKLEDLTKKGLRVLACAHRDYSNEIEYKELFQLANGLSLVGFIALKDPLRKDAKESILTTKKAGIRTVIVTGDHKLTAKAIAQELGIETGEENILEGKELELMSDQDLQKKAKHVSIYARVSPRHKLKIVDALQMGGEVVAMLGDGVNDALALKSADIGVAVGSGTDVAKEVADLVLLDDNFKIVLKAIEQGRVAFQNIRKVFTFMVADDFSELFLFIASLALGFPIPLLPAQILWINVVEDGFPGMALGAEQETKGVMEEKPRDPKESILNKPLKLLLVSVFIITGITAFLSFLIIWKLTGDLEKTRTMVFALMCVDSLAFTLVLRSFKRTVFRKDILSNRYLVGAIAIGLLLLLGAIYLPPLQKLLSTQPLIFTEWLMIFELSFIEICLIEFFKKRIFSVGAKG